MHINTNYLARHCINSMLIPIAMCQHSLMQKAVCYTLRLYSYVIKFP